MSASRYPRAAAACLRGSRALPGGSPAALGRVTGVKEGARGGTQGSPAPKREDALIMWRDASSEEKAS